MPVPYPPADLPVADARIGRPSAGASARTAHARALRVIVRPVRGVRQAVEHLPAQRLALPLGERHRVRGRRALAAEERRPHRVVVGEHPLHLDRPGPHAQQARLAPARAKGAGRQSGRTPSAASATAGSRRTAAAQEGLQQLHAVGVVPDAGRDEPARGGAPHGAHRRGRVGDDVEDEPRHDDVERAGRQVDRVARDDLRPAVGQVLVRPGAQGR